jgi:hypothetical protein
MPIPDALIHRVTLHATAADAGDALRVLRTAEAVIHRAVEGAAAAVGGEVLVLRRVELDFAVDLDGRQVLAAGLMEQALRGALRRAIQRARSEASASGPVVSEQVAWFPSEAAAIAELLAAHAQGRASAWPYASLTLWGATPAELIRACLERGRVLLGDVLAAAIQRLDAATLLGLAGEDLAAAVVATCTTGGERTLSASALPADLRAAVAAEVGRLSSASAAQRDLVALARLFALWPPARDARIPLVDLRLIAGAEPRSREATPAEVLAELLQGTAAASVLGLLPADVVAALIALLRGPREGREAALASLWGRLEQAGVATVELRRAVEGAQAKRLVSAAGGLVAWAALFAAEGLSAEIDAAYPEPRAQRAVRWAIGCALEDARIGGVDPALLLWAGEDPDALIDPGLSLFMADPEPLHRSALRLAGARGLGSTPLSAARFGDTVTLTGEAGFCVDAVPGDDVDRVIPELVRRFARRTGGPPAGISVAPRMSGEAVDALVDVDVPPLPEPFRVAVRAFASAARSALLARWRAPVRALRRWPAIVEVGPGVVVELLRSDVSHVGGGGWLREAVQMGARSVIVRTK